MKYCTVCEDELTEDNFKEYRANNYIWKCNNCMREEKRKQIKQARIKAPELYYNRSVEYQKNLKKENPVKYTCIQMAASARKRAASKGKSFDITTEYLVSIAPQYCPVFGVELKYGGGEKTKSSASLDRIDSSKGYEKGNVQIISNLANMMKNEADKTELQTFALWVLGLRTFEKTKGLTK